MIEALESDYVQWARLKGLSVWRVTLVHALPNALAPSIQVMGLNLLYMAGGIVIVENVFGYPGVGQGLVDAVTARDIPVIQFWSWCSRRFTFLSTSRPTCSCCWSHRAGVWHASRVDDHESSNDDADRHADRGGGAAGLAMSSMLRAPPVGGSGSCWPVWLCCSR